MVEIQIKGLNKLTKIAEKYPAVSEKYINNAIKVSLELIKGVARSNAPLGVTHKLREHWNVELGRFEGKLSSGAKADNGFMYANAVEYGTRPHFVPISAIKPWAEKKGLNPWAVAKSIAKKGTKANPFFQKSADYSQKGVERVFAKSLDDTMRELNNLKD